MSQQYYDHLESLTDDQFREEREALDAETFGGYIPTPEEEELFRQDMQEPTLFGELPEEVSDEEIPF